MNERLFFIDKIISALCDILVIYNNFLKAPTFTNLPRCGLLSQYCVTAVLYEMHVRKLSGGKPQTPFPDFMIL